MLRLITIDFVYIHDYYGDDFFITRDETIAHKFPSQDEIHILDTGVSMLPLILLLVGCLLAFGATVISVMLMMYRRRGTTSPVHIEPYMKQPIITPPDSRNNSMLDVTHGDHTYFVEYTLKQVTDYALNNQPDIIQSPQGTVEQKTLFLLAIWSGPIDQCSWI